MNENIVNLPSPRQTVRIIFDEEKVENSEIYAVVDVVTIDGRVKVFCLENLDDYSLKSSILLEYGYDNALYRSSWKIDFIENSYKDGKDEKQFQANYVLG